LILINFTMKSSVLVAVAQLIISVAIIYKVKYTEIDWTAYMQQVEGFLEGERDYFNLQGDTGPLVYPAGFLYIFTVLYKLTGQGKNILVAQGMFALLQCITVYIVSRLMGISSKVPNIVVILLLLSKRIQSIFVLRLFNDPVGMLLMYGSIYAMVKKKWELSALMYSISLSVKMNVLLFAPGYALLFYQGTGIVRSICNAFLFIGLQGLIGYPFLIFNPSHYLQKSFEFSRQFYYQWTVNWKMIAKSDFESRQFSILLGLLHLSCLMIFFIFVWSRL
jgi:alpha-1,3-mannosyltransferase